MLAKEIGGEIISADSMQIYRDLGIITARPTAAEEARLGSFFAGMQHQIVSPPG
jgi:tRNA A37 N6-isopentenylltransferase MiaA